MKNKKEILILLQMMHNISVVGMPKNDLGLTEVIGLLDKYTRQISLDVGYQYQSISGNKRMEELKRIEESIPAMPACGLPLGVSAAKENIANWLQEELGIIPVDFVFDGSFKFSFLGNQIARLIHDGFPDHQRTKRKKKIATPLKGFNLTGSVNQQISQIKNNFALRDYWNEKKVFYSNVEIIDDKMLCVQFAQKPNEYCWFNEASSKEQKPSESLTEAEAFFIQRNIKEYMEAINHVDQTTDKMLTMETLYKCMGSIEKHTNCRFEIVNQMEENDCFSLDQSL